MEGRSLTAFLSRRLAALAAVLLIVSFIVFSLLYVTPGSPEQILLGSRPATPETVHALREEYHLNDPFLVQYVDWLRNAVHLDFGQSIRTNEPVLSALRSRFSVTAFLAVFA